MPKELTPARRGVPPFFHSVIFEFTKNVGCLQNPIFRVLVIQNVQAGRNLWLVQRNARRLMRPADPRGNIMGVANVAFLPFTMERRNFFFMCRGAKRACQSFDFNRLVSRAACRCRVPPRSCMVSWRESCHRLRRGDGFGLAFDAGRGVANLVRTVVIDGKTPDDRVNRVAVRASASSSRFNTTIPTPSPATRAAWRLLRRTPGSAHPAMRCRLPDIQ